MISSKRGGKKKGYCDESEVGALNRALSGIDAIICATLDTAGFNCSLIESLDCQNSLAIWSTPSFSSKQSTSNLSEIRMEQNINRLTISLL